MIITLKIKQLLPFNLAQSMVPLLKQGFSILSFLFFYVKIFPGIKAGYRKKCGDGSVFSTLT
jgi:hypothetical protein